LLSLLLFAGCASVPDGPAEVALPYVKIFSKNKPAGEATLPDGWRRWIYTANGAAPSRLEQWGPRAGADYNTRRGVAQFVIPSQAQFVLLVLREVGTSVQCSAKNPYQGVIQDISFNGA